MSVAFFRIPSNNHEAGDVQDCFELQKGLINEIIHPLLAISPLDCPILAGTNQDEFPS
jgi:hypothetical protein